MVVDYSNLFQSVREQIPQQDWTDGEWRAEADGNSVRVFRSGWTTEDGGGIYYLSYGEGEDPEQQPIILELVIGDDVDQPGELRQQLRETLDEQDAMKELIGWETPDDDDVFMRKELPSDPLTLLPRLLEEFKKLEVVSDTIESIRTKPEST